MTVRIVFNGREYASSDEMPADVRALYDAAMAQLADTDRDGIPDVVQRGGSMGGVLGIQHTAISLDGKTYRSLDEMPPDVRRRYDEAMAGLDQDRDGVPDVLQGGSLPGTGEGKAFVVHKEFRLGGGDSRLSMRGSGDLQRAPDVGGTQGRRPPGLVVESGTRTGLLLLAAIAAMVALVLWLT